MTDQELQIAISKMLPDKIYISGVTAQVPRWEGRGSIIEETEWLHVCWLIEQTLDPSSDSPKSLYWYHCALATALSATCEFRWAINASWQQRAEALYKVKGVTPTP